jgi:DNA-binding transcriptional LysR family regulator
MEALSKRSIDAGFMGLPQDRKNSDLKVEVLAEEKLMVALPSGHPQAGLKELSLGALKEERFILTSRRNAPLFNDWLIELCKKAGFTPEIVKEVDRAPTVLNYIAAGLGISVFPAQTARSAAPGVSFVPLNRGVPMYRYCMAWRKGESSGPTGQFIEVARQVAKIQS